MILPCHGLFNVTVFFINVKKTYFYSLSFSGFNTKTCKCLFHHSTASSQSQIQMPVKFKSECKDGFQNWSLFAFLFGKHRLHHIFETERNLTICIHLCHQHLNEAQFYMYLLFCCGVKFHATNFNMHITFFR